MMPLFLIGRMKKQRLACRIAAQARDLGIELIKPGVSYCKVATAIEEFILRSGAKVAFPTNIAVNDVAAHYTPTSYDDSVFKAGDVVKLDVGAHIGGYIGDTARTIEVRTMEHKKLIRSSERALEEALKMLRPGVDLGEVGATIESTIRSFGFRPIRNLGGHSIEKFCLHGALTIPNIKETTLGVVRKGDVLAIEPFVTNGKKGKVEESKGGSIYTFITKKPYENRDANLLQHLILTKNDWRFLPFCQRMCVAEAKVLRPKAVELGLRQLVRAGGIYPYKVLKEVSGGTVVQSEHTVLITKTGCEVLTRED